VLPIGLLAKYRSKQKSRKRPFDASVSIHLANDLTVRPPEVIVLIRDRADADADVARSISIPIPIILIRDP